MNAKRNSDESVVPATSANNEATEASTESIEERDSTKRNAEQADMLRTQGRDQSMSFGLHGVREAARKDSQLRFTALLHHVNEDCLRNAFFNLKKTAAVGADGVTWQDYEQDLEDLQMRFARFGLKLHESKTRLIEFGKYAAERRDRRGAGRPETFDFLGFTHYCGKSKAGKFRVKRKTSKKKLKVKLAEFKTWIKQRRNKAKMNCIMEEIKAKLRGHYQYYGITDNSKGINAYYVFVRKMTFKWLNRRSQKKSFDWSKFIKYLEKNPLPAPRIIHSVYS